MMTLKEAIKHCEYKAETLRNEALDLDSDEYEDCVECANEHEQLAGWLTELQERREADRWIPVSEKLPDKNDFVLVYDGSDMLIAWYENEGMSEGWHSFDETYDCYTPIIAWKPLPKPYESEATE